MLPEKLLKYWPSVIGSASGSMSSSDVTGGVKGTAKSIRSLRLGISLPTPNVAMLAVQVNNVKDLLSLIGPVALFRVTREVCAAVEGACVRRMGRRVRISQEGVLAVFGLDKWGEADPTAQ